METEEKDLQDNQILEEPIEQEPEIADVGDAMVPEEGIL